MPARNLMLGASQPAPAEKQEWSSGALGIVALLSQAAWRHLLVHDYAHARLFYAFLHHLQPGAPEWILGEALTHIKTGEFEAARALLAKLKASACSPAQTRARARLEILTGKPTK